MVQRSDYDFNTVVKVTTSGSANAGSADHTDGSGLDTAIDTYEHDSNTIILVESGTYTVSSLHSGATSTDHFGVVGVEDVSNYGAGDLPDGSEITNKPRIQPPTGNGIRWFDINMYGGGTATYHLFENMEFHMHSDDEWFSNRFTAVDGLMVRHIEITGRYPTDANADADAAGNTNWGSGRNMQVFIHDDSQATGTAATEPRIAGEGVVENVTRTGATDYVPYNEGVSMFVTTPHHLGTLLFRDITVEGGNGHAMYFRSPGAVQMERWTIRETAGWNIRNGGGDGSYVRNCTVRWDWSQRSEWPDQDRTYQESDGSTSVDISLGWVDGGSNNNSNFTDNSGIVYENNEFIANNLADLSQGSPYSGLSWNPRGVYWDGNYGAGEFVGNFFDLNVDLNTPLIAVLEDGVETASGGTNTPSDPDPVNVLGNIFQGTGNPGTSMPGDNPNGETIAYSGRDNGKVGSNCFSGATANGDPAWFEDVSNGEYWDNREADGGTINTENAAIDTHGIVESGSCTGSAPLAHTVRFQHTGTDTDPAVTYEFAAPGNIFERGESPARPVISKTGDETLLVHSASGMTANGIVANGGQDLWYCHGDPDFQSISDTSLVDVYVDGVLQQDPLGTGTTDDTILDPFYVLSDGFFAAREGAFVTSAPITMIDSFEDADLSEYSGDTTAYSTATTPSGAVVDGSYTLAKPADSGFTTIQSPEGGGLNAYPSRGDVFRLYFFTDTTDVQYVFYWTTDDPLSGSHYECRVRWPNNGASSFANGELFFTNTLPDASDEPSSALQANTLYYLEIDFDSGDDGAITGELVEESSGTSLASVSVTESSRDTGGILYSAAGMSSGTAYSDYWHIREGAGSGSATTTVTSFESADLTDWAAVTNDKRDWSIMESGMFHPAVGGGSGAPASAKLDSANADYGPVSTYTDLESALSSATSGDLVWVDGNADIDTSTSTLTVGSGVTLASDRGQGGSAGGRLHRDDGGDLLHLNSDARLNGLIVEGPVDGYTEYTNIGVHDVVAVQGSGVTIDNCEIRQGAHSGIAAGSSPTIEYCHIHSCSLSGYGYGIRLGSSHPTIDHCWFDWCRHAVAASSGGGGYDITNSYFGSKWLDHIIDHHGPESGSSILIQNCTIDGSHHQSGTGQNTSYGDTEAIYIRGDGIVDGGMTVEDCRFAHLSEPVAPGSTSEAIHTDASVSSWADANITLTNNEYGPHVNSTAVGAPRQTDAGTVTDGAYSLKAHRDSITQLASQSGLNAYPSQGDDFHARFLLKSPREEGLDYPDAFSNILFCQQDESQHNAYELEIEARNDQSHSLDLQKDDAGTDTSLLSNGAVSTTWSADVWYRAEIDLVNSGTGEMTIDIDIVNEDTGTVEVSVTATDSSSPFTSGGVGVQHSGDADIFYDDWEIV